MDEKQRLRTLLKVQTAVRDALTAEIGKNIHKLAKLEGLV